MADYTVLGASGFIGSRVLRSLRMSGVDVFAPAKGDDSIFERDLGRVYYCIGLTADYASKPFDTIEAHVSLLARLLRNATFGRLVYLSSTRLYDSAPATSAGESDPLLLQPESPRHLYDLSKALGESLCLATSGGRACVARLSSVYDSAEGAPGFLSGLLRRLRTERHVEIDSSPAVCRDYVHVDDVILALKAMLDCSEPGIVNVASGKNVSNLQISAVARQYGRQLVFRRAESPPMIPACSIGKLRGLGVAPTPTLDYVARFLEGSGAF